MGDGGVVFMPSQHVMERLPVSSDTTSCRGNGGGFSLKSIKLTNSQQQQQLQKKHVKKNMNVEKEEFEVEKGEKEEVEEGELRIGKEGVENGEFVREVEKGEFIPDRWRREVEKGEFVPDKRRKGEVEKGEFGLRRGWKAEPEKGEFVPERWRKREVDSKFEFSSGRGGRKVELEKGEITPDKWRKRDVESEECGSGRGRRVELEKGEITPDKWRKRDVESDECGKEKGWFSGRERPTPSAKFVETGSEWRKKSSVWEPSHNRESKIGLRTSEEELGSVKHETGYRKESWLKRHADGPGNSGRKYHGDYIEHPSSKSRRISGDVNADKYHSHSLVDRSARNHSSSHMSSLSRYSSRHDSSLSSRRTHDRHADYFDPAPHDRGRYHDHRERSPAHFERSPHDQARYHDHRNRSPARQRSPQPRARQHDRRDRTPGYSERSSFDRENSPPVRSRHHDRRDRTPGYRSPPDQDQSPHVRTRHHEHRDQTPGNLERSPLDSDRSPRLQARCRDHRNQTPVYLERSPTDQGQSQDHSEASGKSGGSEGKTQNGSQGHEEKLDQRGCTGKDPCRLSSNKQPCDNDDLDSNCGSVENNTNNQSCKVEQPKDVTNGDEPQVNGATDELLSMEEDMDISPPHIPAAESTLGKWFYLDHFGMEQGPSKLSDLKRLVEEGVIQSDHLIKHAGSDWWLTVENAASPSVPVNLPSIVSDTITQLVSPPEAPGNLLADIGDVGQSANQPELEQSVALPLLPTKQEISSDAPEDSKNLNIDERVTALLKGYTVVQGRELETLGEALHMTFEHADLEMRGNSEGFPRSRSSLGDQCTHGREEESGKSYEIPSRELSYCTKDYAFHSGYSNDWFFGRWSCMGGDWKRNDEAVEDRTSKRKLVLNDGYPLCQMPKSGYEDPRWCRKDELYYPSRIRRLNLPPWAFSMSEERVDCNGSSRSSQIKPSLALRGVKGTILPVVRINTCVVNDHVPLVPESRSTVRGCERHSSRSGRPPSSSSDGRSTVADDVSQSKKINENDSQGLQKCIAPIIIPKDRVCSVDELQLPLGDWYYLDGAGHEHGPSSLAELRGLADNGTIQKQTSVFRKYDNIWVPVSYVDMGSKADVYTDDQKAAPDVDSSEVPLSQSDIAMSDMTVSSSSFHSLHPQFIGYTRGKLHELVMKSYKSREFAAAINEVLDPWINAKQPKKELEKHSANSFVPHDMQKFRRLEDDHLRAGKKARLLADDSGDDNDLDVDLLRSQMDDFLFDDLCGDTAFVHQKSTGSETEMESWGLLNGHILARVFHFLRTDMKSLSFSAATCKHWNAAVKFYRDISKQVDLSDAGPNCTDSMFRKIMSCYNKMKITSIVLIGCTNISATTLEEILLGFPCISSVDIRGCSQFRELSHKYQNVKWILSHTSHDKKVVDESGSKIRSLKQIANKSFSLSKAFKSSNSNLNGYSELRDSCLDSKDSEIKSFRQSFYKSKKLLDARKSSDLISRDARMRQWFYRKSESGYKRLEEFLSYSLKDIMKENTFDFFVPKVAEIEDKMKNGYYMGHGLNSVKEDISRMCRDAIKAKTRGGTGDMNHMIMLFIRLATSLDDSSKVSREKDDNPSAGFCSTASIYKKKHNKPVNERKTMNRSNGSLYSNGAADYGEYASDREIKRRLSKLNKRTLDSESETSDDPDRSSEDGDSTASDTESDPDLYSEAGIRNYKRDDYLHEDHPLYSMTEDREWGARMTKASLVPPVTRKYEVIHEYVIIADEEEVQRKMRVALPEDYAEKLDALQNGIEESDIPIVKDYKPRKQLGEEVLEQEVYGIDPYTHNLLLDSMPEELDWSLLEKHLFIEDELLRTLNTQVRNFTGTGNAPMKYSLQPVVEEIQRVSEGRGDKRLLKMCQGILKAMRSRPEDNYVAYRKGLGVVCNREEGFGEDDFVVEFLGEVYPAWKWFEKQDGIRSLQRNSSEPAPEFYNIYLERPKGDRDGYDLVVVDAMHKANYASRICHSCRPNCEAKVTAVDGQYQIGVYSVRPIGYGEEITFDYNSVTESKEEYEASVCLCGSQICRGSYLNLTGEGAYQKVISEYHGMLDRHQLMLEACQMNFVSEEDYSDLRRAGVGTCLLTGLPNWLVAYAARVVRFINYERTRLPKVILNHNLEEKRKFFADICMEVERSDAEVQAEGVYNQRLQNLALTLDKVRYVMRCVYTDSVKAPPPLEKLDPEEIVSVLWKGEGSLVEELIQCMTPHMEDHMLKELKSKIRDHDPSGFDDVMGEVRKSLLWLRDELRDLPCAYKCRHDAAADLIHIYAYTKCFFKVQEYKNVTSPPVYISPLDLGPKYMDKLGSGFKEYCKTYGENYCLGQLIYWHTQNNADPDRNLVGARRGCLLLPDIASFYAKANAPSKQRVYGPRTVKFMLSRMEKQPQRPWPEERIWSFKSTSRIFGSPMLDAVVNKTSLNKEMMLWLKNRPPIFQAMSDR